jgi:hypothetical protein
MTSTAVPSMGLLESAVANHEAGMPQYVGLSAGILGGGRAVRCGASMTGVPGPANPPTWLAGNPGPPELSRHDDFSARAALPERVRRRIPGLPPVRTGQVRVRPGLLLPVPGCNHRGSPRTTARLDRNQRPAGRLGRPDMDRAKEDEPPTLGRPGQRWGAPGRIISSAVRHRPLPARPDHALPPSNQPSVNRGASRHG